MNLTEYAQFGDAFGGIAGTIISLASVAFVYYAYREQVRANDKMRMFQIEQTLRSDIANLKVDLNELHYHTEEDTDESILTVMFTGRAAIETFAEKFVQADNHDRFFRDVFFQDLYFFIGRVDTTYCRILKADVDKDIKHELMRDLSFLYTSRCVKGMTYISTFIELGKMHATVNHVGITPVTHLDAMISFHKRISRTMDELKV